MSDGSATRTAGSGGAAESAPSSSAASSGGSSPASAAAAAASASKPPSNSDAYEDYGYDFYPHREPVAGVFKEPPLRQSIWDGQKAAQRVQCQQNVIWCIENNPMVRLLYSALKKNGCPFKLSRHVSCEPCSPVVNGGFDPQSNQVVICENNATSKPMCCSVLAHEMIHAFDFCRAKLDFKNIEHVACTEVRAAALMHCSFKTALAQSLASPIHVKQRHRDCVKVKALSSVVAVRNVTVEEATAVVEKVFDKCYADLEPFGRISRQYSTEPWRAYFEASLYGYVD